jgi:ABC-type transport system involved in cytochrome c biogenesis permease component
MRYVLAAIAAIVIYAILHAAFGMNLLQSLFWMLAILIVGTFALAWSAKLAVKIVRRRRRPVR